MYRIVFFTGFTPTQDNYGGPSAMAYHFFKYRPAGTVIRVYTTNANNVSDKIITHVCKNLGIEIIVLEDTLYNYFHRRERFETLRMKLGIDKSYNVSNYKLSNRILNEIQKFNPNLVWVYQESLTTVIRQLSKFNLMVSGFDCFALHCNRALRDPYIFANPLRYKRALYEYKMVLHRELQLSTIPCRYFDVGIEDRNMFEIVTGRKDAKFYPHPHFQVVSKEIDFSAQKLSILISGKYDQYTWTDANKLIALLKEHKEFAASYKFTFLGRGWDECSSGLKECGYDVEYKTWVDIYAEECARHDIQIFPISVGSGTKGKVLDALCMGLLCIGSKVAMENIYVKTGHSCFQYSNMQDVLEFLKKIDSDRDSARVIAENGRSQVLKWHNPKRIFKKILDDVVEGIPYDAVSEYYQVVKGLN